MALWLVSCLRQPGTGERWTFLKESAPLPPRPRPVPTAHCSAHLGKTRERTINLGARGPELHSRLYLLSAYIWSRWLLALPIGFLCSCYLRGSFLCSVIPSPSTFSHPKMWCSFLPTGISTLIFCVFLFYFLWSLYSRCANALRQSAPVNHCLWVFGFW